ncbi:MAG: hypothetical protein M3Z85_21880 [Acidobacteriota bacterium]|nr:hypothetical protein [Acidobacteriota bacterium]
MFCAVHLACLAQNVTTDDGSKLFFTSPDRLVGTNQSFRSKLFSWDAMNGVQLVYESPTESVGLSGITGDGSLCALGLSGENGSQSHGALLHLDTGRIELVGAMALISRNGRYLFTGDAVIDRIAGTSRRVPVRRAFVGSDGSILYSDGRNLHRIDPDGTDRIVRAGLSLGSLDGADENTTTAILSFVGPQVLINTITGRETDLTTLTAATPTNKTALLSNDGQWVAFEVYGPTYTTRRVILCRADASGCKFLTGPSIDAFLFAISGDGSTVYAVSAGRYLHIDTGTGRTEQAVVFGLLTPRDPPFVPGSLVRFSALTGDHITVNGREAPLLSPPGGLPVIQIPWDLPEQPVTFTMYGGDSPFEILARYPVSDFYPQGFAPGSPGLNEGQPAYRQDWSATTYQSPAVPGEIVHIYAVGLGATDCAVETGKPAPVDRLCRITRRAEWKWTTALGVSVPAEILFAGLAPGMIGLYQIDVRVPPFNDYAALKVGELNPEVAVIHIRQP